MIFIAFVIQFKSNYLPRVAKGLDRPAMLEHWFYNQPTANKK